MRFLHAADIHLGSPMSGLPNRPGGWGDPTREAFVRLIQLARDEDVAFVVIAGDLLDSDCRDYSTALFFAEQMHRLGRPCFLVRGNHDATSLLTRTLTLPPNVTEFSARTAECEEREDLGVAIHGRSFPQRAVTEDLVPSFKPPVPGLFNIGILHTSGEDPGRHDRYAPCTLATLQAKGYGYWALGHIHDRRVLSAAPWVVFPGNTQGRHINETGAKGATIVQVDDGHVLAVHHSLDVLRWTAPSIDLTGAATMLEVVDRVRDGLEDVASDAESRPVVARVHLHGQTATHGALLADLPRLKAECANAALLAGDVHIEGVRLGTRPMAQGDGYAALRASFEAALGDATVRSALLDDFRSLTGVIPRGQHEPPPELPADEAGLRELAPEAWEIVLNALAAAG